MAYRTKDERLQDAETILYGPAAVQWMVALLTWRARRWIAKNKVPCPYPNA